jgi:cell division protein ZapE
MSASVLGRYRDLVGLSEIECDPAQLEAAERLDRLAHALRAWRPARTGLLGLFGRATPVPPRGVYIHGAVGRGKTMLMDLFHETVTFSPKQRSHFHEFMADVHEGIANARRANAGDPIPVVAAEIAAKARLLCFDELHVTDIADAMILGRLFKQLFERGIVVVATSNASPAELYKNGLNRQLFLPFIDLIEEQMDVVELKAAKDFRLDKLAGRPLYFTPADAAARAALDAHWERLTGHHAPAPVELEIKGRRLHVPLAAMGVARFGFADLCERPLGSLDFLRVAHAFHTLLIDGIPVLSPSRRDIARRFITLVDTLYDSRVCLIASAEAEPGQLYPRGDGAELFQRTASRLMEMRSEAYLSARSARAARAVREEV